MVVHNQFVIFYNFVRLYPRVINKKPSHLEKYSLAPNKYNSSEEKGLILCEFYWELGRDPSSQ